LSLFTNKSATTVGNSGGTPVWKRKSKILIETSLKPRYKKLFQCSMYVMIAKSGELFLHLLNGVDCE
jgi:hypothetical protein